MPKTQIKYGYDSGLNDEIGDWFIMKYQHGRAFINLFDWVVIEQWNSNEYWNFYEAIQNNKEATFMFKVNAIIGEGNKPNQWVHKDGKLYCHVFDCERYSDDAVITINKLVMKRLRELLKTTEALGRAASSF